jgi:DNA polymerase-3 subunit alpha (Gram-positive type)
LYAKNQLGIKELYKIISLSSTTYLAGVPRVVESLYKENSANLILANHPTESDVFDAALNDTVSVLREKIKKYDYIFVSSYKSLLHEINRGIYSLENIKEAISLIIKIASEQNKKVIAVSDAYYSHP